MNTLTKKLIALDIDGTILSYDGHTPSPGIREQLMRLSREHHLILASGRSAGEVMPLLDRLGLGGDSQPQFIVCCNGSVTLMKTETGYRREHIVTFDPRDVLEYILEVLPRVELAAERADGVYVHTPSFPLDYLHDNKITGTKEDIVGLQAARIVVYEASINSEEIAKRFENKAINFNNAWGYWDIMPPGVNKATAVSFVRRYLKVEHENVLTAGDGFNDIEMLRWAKEVGGTSLAMGQASNEVKAAASRVIGSVYEGGLAQALAEVS